MSITMTQQSPGINIDISTTICLKINNWNMYAMYAY